MSEKSNIAYYLLQEKKKLDVAIDDANRNIQQWHLYIEDKKKQILRLQAHRQALIMAAIDYGWHPDTDEVD